MTEKSLPKTDNKTRYGDEASLSYISYCSKRNLKYPLCERFEIFKPQYHECDFLG